MKRKPHSTSLVLLLVCIFTFWWGISVLAQYDGNAPMRPQVEYPNSMPVGAPATDQAVAATPGPLLVNESMQNGTFVYTGTFTPNNPCDSFGSGIRYSAADGGHVTILLITQPPTVACAQAAGAAEGQPFSVSIKVAKNTTPTFDGVQLNGATITSQLSVR